MRHIDGLEMAAICSAVMMVLVAVALTVEVMR